MFIKIRSIVLILLLVTATLPIIITLLIINKFNLLPCKYKIHFVMLYWCIIATVSLNEEREQIGIK